MYIDFLFTDWFQFVGLPIAIGIIGALLKGRAYPKDDPNRKKNEKYFIGLELFLIACISLILKFIQLCKPYQNKEITSIPILDIKEKLLPTGGMAILYICLLSVTYYFVRKYGWRKPSTYNIKRRTVFIVDTLGVISLAFANLIINKLWVQKT